MPSIPELLEYAASAIAALDGYNFTELPDGFIDALTKRYEKSFEDSYGWSLLGSGSSGDAYDMHDGTVLKLTRDVKEARASAKLLRADDTPHLLRIYDVVQFALVGDPTAWAIRQEKLAKPDKKFVNIAMFWRSAWQKWGTLNVPVTAKSVMFFLQNYEKESKRDVRYQDLKRQDIFDFGGWLNKVYKEAMGYGITVKDIHGGNIMCHERGSPSDADNLVLIDLGISELKGRKPKIDVLKVGNR